MSKKIILFLSLGLILVLIIVLVALTMVPKKASTPEPVAVPTSPATTSEVVEHQPKPIELEWMSAEEKAALHINTSAANRIQVLERDKDGKITAYKLIKSDADILTNY